MIARGLSRCPLFYSTKSTVNQPDQSYWSPILLNVNSSNSQENPIDSELPEKTSENAGIESKTRSMDEFYQLKTSLLLVTLGITGIAFLITWVALSLQIALNYLFGAAVGLIYLRMLAKYVEKINVAQQQIASGRLAVFVGMIVVAARVEQLSILPVFLGFLTYKVVIIGYVGLQSLMPDLKEE
ncbi:hypothetical protein Lepto7376_4389 [[Leptolyngbya] sp. PCC 7376]|uniref:ATP synthase subunit I n=1 Tax=[Leptolyngbya] sp. PCC 7376 TaxID=111781 RepID=UPI00029EFD10|nr:ATP synthase subunit I [[Leptolyngbya] sp. PCC 7376]AFY40497.1 hypothetical protein Lepto7376_4389 [[Leptolyngbya] sp. PCC 7376]